MKKLTILGAFLLATLTANAQDDLMDLFEEDSTQTQFVQSTFKSPRLVLGQSVENPKNGSLILLISHQFGRINSGFYDFWGLENAVTRIGLEYGFNDHFAIGIGRSTNSKLADLFIKVKLMRQSSGAKKNPLSISYFANVSSQIIRKADLINQGVYNSRNQFVQQILIARKFSNAFSFQLSPTYLYRELVDQSLAENNVFALGMGGRLKITNRTTFNTEYFILMSNKVSKNYKNTFSMGFDIETGGHVFQLYLSNAQGLVEQLFIPQTTGDWGDGGVYFGFNITRDFNLKKKKDKMVENGW